MTTQRKGRDLGKMVIRAAMAWYGNESRLIDGKASGLRILTTGDLWHPSTQERRLANACYAYAKTKRRKR